MSIKNTVKRGLRYIIKGVPNNITKVSVSCTSPSNVLKGKSIIITGGGRGLGYTMAKRLTDEGANVLISGRKQETLEKAAKEIGCQYLTLDVQKPETFKQFFIDAENKIGKINCLVNNAGISLHEPSFTDVSIEQFNSQINTNLRGSFFMAQEFVKYYRYNGLKHGNILFTTSETGMTVDNRPYGLTKAALNSLTQGLAYTLIKEGIRVNAVAPGVTTSDMTGYQKDGNLYSPNGVTDRIYLPKEVAEIACFLLSDCSHVLNGQILVCNEGKTINFRK